METSKVELFPVARRRLAPLYICIRQHTSAYASIRQHTSAYVCMRRALSSRAQASRSTIYMHMYTCIYVYVYVYVYIYVCVCVCVCVYIHTYIHKYIHTYIHKYIWIYIHTYMLHKNHTHPSRTCQRVQNGGRLYQVPYVTVILTSTHYYPFRILTCQNKTNQVVLSSSNRTRPSTIGSYPVWLLDQFFFSI
jgi:hypothetical protein